MLRYIFSSRYRLSTYILTVLYLFLYDFIFREYLFPLWRYMGTQYHDISGCDYIIFLLFGAFPALFYKGLKNVASGISIMIFIFGVLPCYHAVCTMNSLSTGTVLGYAIAFIVCGTMFFMSDSIYLYKKPFITIRKKFLSIKTVEVITLLMLALLVITYRSQMTFVNFLEDADKMYDQRAENSNLSVIGIVLYFRQWLTNGFFPFLLVIYLQTKNRLKVGLVLLGYLLVFMIEMAKSTFFMPIVILCFYALINHRRNIVRYYYSSLLILITIISLLLLNTYQDNEISYSFASIFFMRTMCVEGWLCDLYIPFFENHPFTYFSHINIINFFTQAYPYADSIGRTVSGGTQNANAFFLLMDGVAGAGIFGVYFVSVIFIIVKGILNSISLKYDTNLCVLIFLPASIAIINVSLFTSILTCGLLILYLLFVFVKAPMLQRSTGKINSDSMYQNGLHTS